MITVDTAIDAVSFRRLMIALKTALERIHEARMGNRLVCLSASRFDQKRTTPPHLDGGPVESLLLSGYEPSPVDSEISIADYARCTHDLGITPEDFLARFNPLFPEARERLQPYTFAQPCFRPDRYQLVCINNSSAAVSTDRPVWQGVLHAARIGSADPSEPRMINSMMIGTAPPGCDDGVSPSGLSRFARASGTGCWE